MEKIKNITFLILIFSFTIHSISGCIDSNNEIINNDNGENFSFQGLDGLKKNLSDFRGKIVILDMWATWCSPCGYQMIELEKLYNYYNKELIEIISIDIDQRETIDMIKNYISNV